jgi:hypothetical protein
MAAFPYVIWRAMRAVLPNTPSKISVPFINSAPGKNCLVPSPFVYRTGLRRVHAAKSNNKEASDKSLEHAASLRITSPIIQTDHTTRTRRAV